MKDLTISIDQKKLMMFLAVFPFVLFEFTSGLTYTIFKSQTILLAVFFVSIVCVFLYGFRRRFELLDMSVVAMIAVMTLNNNQEYKHGVRTALYASVAILVFYLFAKNIDGWHRIFITGIGIAGGFYALATIVLKFTPNFFINTVAPLFINYGGASYVQSNINNYLSGYMPGFSPHYSTNAIYLAVGTAVPAAVFITGKLKDKKWWALLAVLMVALLLTGKRAHIIFAVAAAAACYYFFTIDRPVTRIKTYLFVGVAGVLLLVVAAQFMPSLLNVVYRFIETAESGDVSLGRSHQRALAFQWFLEHPVLGMGWNAYQYRFLDINGYMINVHCVYAQLLCENGLVGSIPFYLFFVVSLVHIIKSVTTSIRRRIEMTSFERIVMAAAIYMQIFFLLYCLTGNPLYDEEMLIPYILSCAIGEFYYRRICMESEASEVKKCTAQY